MSIKKTFLTINFGCRVNAAEINQLAQSYLNQGFAPFSQGEPPGGSPSVIIVNTCSVTKKGDIESLSRIRILRRQYPNTQIIATGCARLEKIKDLPQITILNNNQKNQLSSLYTANIKDKFSHTHRYLLKIQSGCTQMCTYCIVPYRRPQLWSLPLDTAVKTVQQAVVDGYQEVIITGVNIEQYSPKLSNLLEKLLEQTNIQLISFGSIPVNCIDDKFIQLLEKYQFRIKNFLHIPIQSGSDKILKLMHRPYSRQKILKVFYDLQSNNHNLIFGTDIIVGFPQETEDDFKETLDLCRQIGFKKIHSFKFSPRPHTAARTFWQKSKVDPQITKKRQTLLRPAT